MKTIAIDEADEILSRGFKDRIELIITAIQPKPQVCYFIISFYMHQLTKINLKVIISTATMFYDLDELTISYLNNPYKFIKQNNDLNMQNILSFFQIVEKEVKFK